MFLRILIESVFCGNIWYLIIIHRDICDLLRWEFEGLFGCDRFGKWDALMWFSAVGFDLQLGKFPRPRVVAKWLTNQFCWANSCRDSMNSGVCRSVSALSTYPNHRWSSNHIQSRVWSGIRAPDTCAQFVTVHWFCASKTLSPNIPTSPVFLHKFIQHSKPLQSHHIVTPSSKANHLT